MKPKADYLKRSMKLISLQLIKKGERTQINNTRNKRRDISTALWQLKS